MSAKQAKDAKYDWVHPSWRDVAIEYLMSHPADRRRFLSTCGVAGIELALSRSGGAAGDRELPLLVGDPDWQHLQARVLAILPGASTRDHDRVLRAIQGLIKLADGPPKVAHRIALQRSVLATIREAWNHRGAAVDHQQLAAYFDVSLEALPLVSAPDLTRSIAEYVEPLLKADAQLHYRDCAEALALVAVINTNEPRALVIAEWPSRYTEPIQTILTSATACLERAGRALDVVDEPIEDEHWDDAEAPTPRSEFEDLSHETWGWRRVMTFLARAGVDDARRVERELARAESAVDNWLIETELEEDDEAEPEDELEEHEPSDERFEIFEISQVLSDL